MQNFLDPLVLASIKDMPLVAKTVAQGFLHGRHNSVQRGTGIEFSQYRSYEPGDALNAIDWKLFARSDRYFVREAERESNINIWLVVDASGSMLQKSAQSAKAWHKLDYAKHLLASIGYIALQQGDAFGLLGLSSDKLDFLPALTGHQQWQKLLLKLEQMQAGAVFPDPQLLLAQLAKMQSNSIIFIVSDFYQKNHEITDFMQNLVGKSTEVVAVQLDSNDENTFPYKGLVRFEEQESHEHILVSAQEVKADYLKAREAFNLSLAQQFHSFNIHHIKTNIEHPLDDTLRQFLAVRQKS
ncbi:DUF58 domain-containing protein [Paraglaciecola aestuariivivens]